MEVIPEKRPMSSYAVEVIPEEIPSKKNNKRAIAQGGVKKINL